jgi:hypothetical protein
MLARIGVEDGHGLAYQHVDVHVARAGVEAPQAITMSVVQGSVSVPLTRQRIVRVRPVRKAGEHGGNEIFGDGYRGELGG